MKKILKRLGIIFVLTTALSLCSCVLNLDLEAMGSVPVDIGEMNFTINNITSGDSGYVIDSKYTIDDNAKIYYNTQKPIVLTCIDDTSKDITITNADDVTISNIYLTSSVYNGKNYEHIAFDVKVKLPVLEYYTTYYLLIKDSTFMYKNDKLDNATVTIPSTIALEKKVIADVVKYEGSGDISTDTVRLKKGSVINITMASDFTLASTEDATLNYTVKAGTTPITETGATVAKFSTSETAQSVKLSYSADDPEYAGDYSDTVTFTLNVVTE